MIAPDANLLIYAYDPVSPVHTRSRNWLQDVLSDTHPVGLPILSVYGFLRFVTNPRIAREPLTFGQASSIVDTWLALPHVRLLFPGERHWQIFHGLCSEVRLRGGEITDAAIAAIALEYGATVYSHDRDFAHLPRVQWHDPLS